MSRGQILKKLRAEIMELMGALSIEEIMSNKRLIAEIESLLSALSEAS